MRATSTLTKMGAAAREQLRGASAVDSRTDEPRRRTLHGQHSRANARETEQMCGDSSSGGAHFSMQKSWQMAGYDSAFAPAGAIGRREENCALDPSRITILGLAASLLVARAIVACSTMRQPRCLQHEPPLLVVRCGEATEEAKWMERLRRWGREIRWGLPLTPSAGWTLPEGAREQCPRGLLALRGKRHF